GVHAQPTRLVLSFDEPLDPARAQDPANYRLVDPRNRPVHIDAAIYDPATRTVTLHPRQRLGLNLRYVLAVNGANSTGLADAAGNLLDGDGDNRPGGNFATAVDRRNLALPGPAPRSPLSPA